MSNIAILASGTGSNALKIIDHFKKSKVGDVKLVVSNKSTAGVLNYASKNAIESLVFENSVWKENPLAIVNTLRERQIDFVVLAGFLRKVPDELIEAYPRAMVNIHPALLPKYGGKGMYGMHVHNAVKENGDDRTGITIHWVTSDYDEGEIIFQESVEVKSTDDASAIQKKVQKLEHEHFAPVIESLLKSEE
jgi:phosphoribosylglycinamide formyltransferase-1